MKKLIIITIFYLIPAIILSQTKTRSAIAFYNVENLFDTINDPITKDDDFTPEGRMKWTEARYQKKLNNIAKVISSINGNEIPDMVGFAEVENRTVLEDLIKTEFLKTTHYKIVHEESPDIRGIDVGLIYNSDHFKYLKHQKIPIKLNTGYKVRDILYIKGILDNTDTLHVFVNHWKSMLGGQEKTEPQRMQCAQKLKHTIDSILSVNGNSKILVMGDFNETPTDKSIHETLKANNTNEPGSLYDLMLPLSKEGLGTHNYRGNWSVLDQIIISNNLLNNHKGFVVSEGKGHIFSADWITYTSKNGNKSPNRTYGGPNYYGGYSDHYPVYVILEKQ